MNVEIKTLLREAAQWICEDPLRHSDYLDIKLAPLGYQLVRIGRSHGRWVLLKNQQLVDYASAKSDYEAIRMLASYF